MVVDASVVVLALVGERQARQRAHEALLRSTPVAPDLVLLEALSALRRLSASGEIDGSWADLAAQDIADLPIDTVDHRPLLGRCWAMRAHITVYDAAYVALAMLVDRPLLTADRRLARAASRLCQVELLAQ